MVPDKDGGSGMTADRREAIKDLLVTKGTVTYAELSALYPDLSGMTLRRDIDFLAEQGVAEKVRGGARTAHLHGPAREDMYSARATEAIEEKQAIARKALAFIQPGRSIFIDSGSTMMCLAQRIPDTDLSILTSGPNIALEILSRPNPKVTVIGGQISRNNLSVSGPNSIGFIRNINIDIAFVATSGFSLKAGFTNGDYNEGELKRAVIRKAGKTVLMMDSDKVDRNLPYTFAGLRDIDVLITDDRLPEDTARKIRAQGVEVL
jgi:DeoR/GlpR family transcriptional regulator of sugar metabolism